MKLTRNQPKTSKTKKNVVEIAPAIVETPVEAIESPAVELAEVAPPTETQEQAVAPVAAEEPKVFYCCCGCDEKLVTAKLLKNQKCFRMGHDARLHGKLNQIAKGKLGRNEIPQVARENYQRIGFLKKDAALLKLFTESV